MAGIYLHIPFCKQACHYCNFHFSTSVHLRQEMINAMQQELLLRKDYITESIDTIYFGGGTPSLLKATDIEKMLQTVYENYRVNECAEITLEANPDDMHPDSVKAWKETGINRLSVGIQSFNEAELQWMNRAHTATEALKSIELAREAGIENISIDLIYGSQLLSDEQWVANLHKAIALQVTHLSCYALTVEPRTALHHFITHNKVADTDSEKQSRHFEMMQDILSHAGFIQYEISNFCKPGYQSRHNSSYWQGISYSGIGPAAHSFNGKSRQWNIAHNKKYIDGITTGNLPTETETLTVIQQMNEHIMIRLRLLDGISLPAFENYFGIGNTDRLLSSARDLQRKSHLIISESNIRLSPSGRFFADGIASDLFFED